MYYLHALCVVDAIFFFFCLQLAAKKKLQGPTLHAHLSDRSFACHMIPGTFSFPNGCGSKIGTQNATLVNGNND